MHLPEQLLRSLEGTKGFDKNTFESVHASDDHIVSVRYNQLKQFDSTSLLARGYTSVPWASDAWYLPERPSFTFDPFFHAGCYYVQEASSMFLEQALRQHLDFSRPLRVLDLCAAPGGKSTHIQSLISEESLLVSNDVIRSRANILKENIIKWGSHNVVVTNNDPKDFKTLPNYFDVIVVDAPCSGSGLFRRDADAIEEWSENNVALCSQRQRRILADIWPALKKNGLLIYSTCSYSREEDEDILEWMIKELTKHDDEREDFIPEPLAINLEENWNIVSVNTPSGGYGYRFWPDKVKGEGLFLSCFRKKDGGEFVFPRFKNQAVDVEKKELPVLAKWTKQEGIHFIKHLNTVYGWPLPLSNDFNLLLQQLRMIYSGTIIGELVRDKMIPDHALGMGNWVNESIESIELTYDQAISYLQKKDLAIEPKHKGWQLVTYEGKPLGWINALANRINNYYPREMRILKEKSGNK